MLNFSRYVRQRMGRNKLKSFGPVMCRMAMLVHVRCGSFFFKALGITLLFMAGFPGDLVQRETKYRNLDLLQKYYRYMMPNIVENVYRKHYTLDKYVKPIASYLSKHTIFIKYRIMANSLNKNGHTCICLLIEHSWPIALLYLA